MIRTKQTMPPIIMLQSTIADAATLLGNDISFHTHLPFSGLSVICRHGICQLEFILIFFFILGGLLSGVTPVTPKKYSYKFKALNKTSTFFIKLDVTLRGYTNRNSHPSVTLFFSGNTYKNNQLKQNLIFI